MCAGGLAAEAFYFGGEPFGTGADGPFHAVFPIHLNQTELWPPAVGPLEVIQQTPVKITFYLYTLADSSLHGNDGFF